MQDATPPPKIRCLSAMVQLLVSAFTAFYSVLGFFVFLDLFVFAHKKVEDNIFLQKYLNKKHFFGNVNFYSILVALVAVIMPAKRAPTAVDLEGGGACNPPTHPSST